METTKERIERLKWLNAERTPGEWAIGFGGSHGHDTRIAVKKGGKAYLDAESCVCLLDGEPPLKDADFIAAAPAMMAVIGELEQRLAVASEAILELKRCCGTPITDRQAEEKFRAMANADAALAATDLDKPFP